MLNCIAGKSSIGVGAMDHLRAKTADLEVRGKKSMALRSFKLEWRR